MMGLFLICDTDQNPTEPGFGIDLAHAASFDEAVRDGGGVARGRIASLIETCKNQWR
tara:strand:- start:7552 stop:7722 length:171 start_codon:yes stop_codon:yes gene_type:complete